MKTLSRILLSLSLVASVLCTSFVSRATAAEDAKIRVLVVTGGHGFQQEPFYAMFSENAEIVFKKAEYPAATGLLTPDLAKDCDVIVFYDMWARGIEPAQQKAFAQLVRQGIGVVALHHTMAAHQNWPEYAKIIGGKYNMVKRTVDGVEIPNSGFKHGVDVPVTIAKTEHPITAGMKDFTIHDETYINYETDPKVTVLLTTDEPTSDPELAWVKTHGKSRVFFLQLGHDRFAYEHPSYRKLLSRGIAWTAGRL